jgi:hypothetical protein
MSRSLFRPSVRQIVWLGGVLLASIVCALSVRYQLIEQSAVGIRCEAEPATWPCTSRRAAIRLHSYTVFGGVAAAAALLNLLRPSVVLCTVTLLAGGAGIVLYNTALSALAAALLILSLARPAPEPE